MGQGDWDNPGTRSMGALLGNGTERLLILLNAHHEEIGFALPEADEGWLRLLDTATGDVLAGRGEPVRERVALEGRSLMVLESRAAGDG